MKTIRSLLLLLTIVAVSVTGMFIAPAAAARPLAPDRLEIVRTPGIHSDVSYALVARPHLVETLYTHMLSLPAAPASQICPMYMIASYQLTFFHNNAVIRKVKALNGQCGQVTLSSNDIRIADSTFWALIQQANQVGKLISPH